MTRVDGLDTGRFGHLLLLIGFVTAIIGFLIAAGATYDDQTAGTGR